MLNLRLTTDSESEWFQLRRLPDAWHMHKKIDPRSVTHTDRLTIASLLLPCFYDDRRQDQRESQWFHNVHRRT